MVAVVLAATLSGTRTFGEDPNQGSTGEVEQLRAYTATLLQEIEQLRAEVARLGRERDELAKEVAEARHALQALKAEEHHKPSPEIAQRDPIEERRVPESSRVAATAETERSDPGRAGRVEVDGKASAARGAEIGPRDRSGGHRMTTEQSPASSGTLPTPSVSPSKGSVGREPASRERIEGLEAELREVHQREQALRASAKDLEVALDAEKQAGQSKLEALQSVLLDTRSTSTQLRAELDETRQRNTELSNEVSLLHAETKDAEHLEARAQPQGATGVQEPSRILKRPKKQIGPSGSLPAPPQLAQPKDLANAAGTSQPTAVEPPEDPVATKDLREQLSVERERRETLEEEVKRLTTSGNSDDRFVEVWNALQSARSEILVLSNQLAEERKDREDLEVALERTQQDPANKSSADLAKRLAATLDDRRSEADRLAAQLKDANEIIVRLKGRLEASGTPEGEDNLLAELQKDNETLRNALKAAEEANQALRGKAEMAQRLAEIVYGKGP